VISFRRTRNFLLFTTAGLAVISHSSQLFGAVA
jgi:hypothetical protein